MLQAAARNDGMVEEGGYRPEYAPTKNIQVGDELRRAARRLHDALGRMEEAVSFNAVLQRTASSNDGLITSLQQENDHLANAYADAQQECVTLQHEITALKLAEQAGQAELADMREKNKAVSQQVVGLSTKLEALIDRLGKLLEE